MVEKRSLTFLVFIFLFLSCTSAFATDFSKMFSERCAVCHSLNPPPKLAPPFRGIIMHYSQEYRSREDFARAVATFVRKEEGRKVLLPDAQEYFGPMPVFPYDEQELIELASWIWDELSTSPMNMKKS